MSPMAYMYIAPCEENRVSYVSCEYFAVTQTIQEDPSWNSGTLQYNHRATAVQYYTFSLSTTPDTTAPNLVYSAEFGDPEYSLYYWMPSNAIDNNEDVGYTFAAGNSSTYPSPYIAEIDKDGTVTTPSSILTGGGANAATNNWGEFVSLSIDPTNDTTFWGTGEYFDAMQTSCTDSGSTTTCTWLTQIFCWPEGGSGSACP